LPFFFESLKSLNSRYRGLFNGESEEDGEGVNRNESGFARYGWTITIEHLCKELGLTPNEVYNMHIHEFLYWCQYYKAKNEETLRQHELQKMKSR
jgi:hypothetical protein